VAIHSNWGRMQGRDINLDIKRVVAYRHWCNKLWNAIKFAMINLGDDFVPVSDLHNPQQLPFGCQWILSRLTAAVDSTIKALHEYQFQSATQVCFCCAGILKTVRLCRYKLRALRGVLASSKACLCSP